MYMEALKIKEDKQKEPYFFSGSQETFETLSDTGDNYKTVKEKLDEYFSPKENIDYEIFQFHQATQQPDETVEQFVMRLRKLAATWEFHDASREIKSAVIQNCLSKRLQRYTLQQDNNKLTCLQKHIRNRSCF